MPPVRSGHRVLAPGTRPYAGAVQRLGDRVEDRPAPRDDARGRVAVTTGLIALGAFALLWCLMWIPSAVLGSGWLILYPLFLVAWVPIGLLALVSLVSAVMSLARREGRRRRAIAMLVVDAVFLVVSPSVLWLGAFPLLALVTPAPA